MSDNESNTSITPEELLEASPFESVTEMTRSELDQLYLQNTEQIGMEEFYRNLLVKNELKKTHIAEIVYNGEEFEVQKTGEINYDEGDYTYTGYASNIASILEEECEIWRNRKLTLPDELFYRFDRDRYAKHTRNSIGRHQKEYNTQIAVATERGDEYLDVQDIVKRFKKQDPRGMMSQLTNENKLVKYIRYHGGLDNLPVQGFTEAIRKFQPYKNKDLTVDDPRNSISKAFETDRLEPHNTPQAETNNTAPRRMRELSEEEIKNEIEKSDTKRLQIGELVVVDDTPIIEVKHTGWIGFRESEYEYTGDKKLVGQLVEKIGSEWKDKAYVMHDNPAAKYQISNYIEKFRTISNNLYDDRGLYIIQHEEAQGTPQSQPAKELKKNFNDKTEEGFANVVKLAEYIRHCGGLENITAEELSKGVSQYPKLLPAGERTVETLEPGSNRLKEEIEFIYNDGSITLSTQ